MCDQFVWKGTGLYGLYQDVERLLLGDKRSDRDEGQTHRRSPQPHRPCSYGEPKLEGNDPGKGDKLRTRRMKQSVQIRFA